ncbi:MAG: hypothetical protein KatS3mg002_0349 [Candidatus Woesearchaeota archaeon]|nr:MAG: hypothetical protein KatS3mg002_0349 [Candidatus Woesearchaeota archaeon]
MKVRAIEDKIFVKVIPIEGIKTKSGLILPESMNPLFALCEVLSVGEKVETVKPGDKIMCHPRGGQEIIMVDENAENSHYKILAISEIYGIIEGDKNES